MKKIKILLVDDEIAEMLRGFIPVAFAQRVEMTSCTDEQSACQAIEMTDFDVAFLDLFSPTGAYGLRLANKIKEKSPATIVVGMTGKPDAEEIEQWRYDYLLLKVFYLEDVRKIAEEITERLGNQLVA